MTWNLKPSSQWQRLLVALLIVAGASVIRALFFDGLGRNTPYLLYFPAVMLAALYGGLASGFLATVFSAALSFFWIQRGFLSPVESLALAVFCITCTMIFFLCEMLLRTQKRARLAQEKAETANQELRSEVAERKRAEEALRTEIAGRKEAQEAVARRADELAQFNAAAVGRELRMVELKEQVNGLARRLGQPPPYEMSFLDGAVQPTAPEVEGAISGNAKSKTGGAA
jgi:K+-sensing histidine kinase KdpD